MATGGPPPPPPASIAPPAPAPSQHAITPTPPAPVRMMLEGIAMQVDADLARANVERARAMASLAATLMLTQGQAAPPSDSAWLMWFGESFYRWQFFAEGAEYWKGVFQWLKTLGKEEADDGLRAVATAGAFQVLAGDVPPNAAHARSVAAFVQKVYGPSHVLTRDVIARLGGPLSVSPPSMPPASNAVNLTPSPPRLPPELAGLDGTTQLALWVTLAFLDVGAADGVIDETEYGVWKQTMTRLQLPDVWARFGADGLQRMLQSGVLHALSADFATLPDASRTKLAGMLIEFMAADGRVDPAEVAAIQRIGGWLGVTLDVG